MSNFTDFIGGGGGSEVNDVKFMTNSDNLITTESGEVWLKGGVTETDTTTYPNATASLAYSGTSFSTATQVGSPFGITWDGTYFWVLDGANDAVFKYSASGVYQNVSWSVASQGTSPTDIVWDGSFFWVINNAASPYKRVSKYNAAGVYQNVFWEYNAVTTMDGEGLAWDGTFFYVIGNVTDTIRKFNAAGVDQGVSYSVAAQETNPKGITFDGTYLWVVGTTSDTLYKYSTSGVYQNESLVINIQDVVPQGIAWDGTSLCVTGVATDTVYKYSELIGCGAGTEGTNNNLYTRIK